MSDQAEVLTEGPTEADINEVIKFIVTGALAQHGDPPDSKQSIRGELRSTLSVAYDLGLSEKWMRKAVDRAINEIKASEHWDGRKWIES